MTDGQLALLLISVGAIGLFLKKKKPQEMFIEIVEFVPVKPKRSPLVNMLVAGGVLLFLWIMAHGQ